MTPDEAYTYLRARLEDANAILYDQATDTVGTGDEVPVVWQNEGAVLPDVADPFIYVEFLSDPGQIVAFGGGRGSNLYRYPARLDIYVFIPSTWGLSVALRIGEAVASRYRSQRSSGTGQLSIDSATVIPGGHGSSLKPPGFNSEVDNYGFATVAVTLSYDQVG